MLAVFCLRLAAGMLACLLLLPPRLINPRFYRTHFLTALALACFTLLWVRHEATGFVLGLLVGAIVLAFLGSVTWAVEGAPAGRALIVLTSLTLAGVLVAQEASFSEPPLARRLVGDATAAAVLGAALTAMLLGHSYLIAPSMSIRPLQLLLVALAVAVLARVAADGYGLGSWTAVHSLAKLRTDWSLWLPVRWGVGLLAPLVLDGMAWQTSRIRSTQSATGILYVAVIFCFLGELTGQLLRDSGITL